ncbi:TetR/AcrR family transcriptional regulator [Kordiimonas pumila]|uniref:TetR/AcrR family transcriptional regulator n=1 Tax=Kordiimonas pumila TaxID=2161677 RepID=A0ABV7D856_9PROT|nr:TetR/AcrR family transcriptional regulator [Kordiimonas pumila]
MKDIKKPKPAKATRGRPRDESKNIAIIEAAVQLFLEKGFDSTSMDEVARVAGVSKQTVYSHFSGKEQLFSASIRAEIESRYPDTVLKKLEKRSLEGDMLAVCESFAGLLLSRRALSMYRLLVSAADEKPGLAKIFWESGPNEMEAKLEAFLQMWVDRGELAIDDIGKACNLLFTLLKGRAHYQRSIGLIDEIDDDMIKETVKEAIGVFMKLYKA